MKNTKISELQEKIFWVLGFAQRK